MYLLGQLGTKENINVEALINALNSLADRNGRTNYALDAIEAVYRSKKNNSQTLRKINQDAFKDFDADVVSYY